MFGRIKSSEMPKFLKWLIYIVLTLTCIYWICWFIYKFFSILRIVLHWVTEPRNWWTFLCCLLILAVGSLLVAQFALNLDPFGKFIQAILGKFKDFRTWLANYIEN